MNTLSSLPEWLLFLIVVGISVSLTGSATLTAALRAKGRTASALTELHKTASSSVSTVLTFLLGFLVVTSWGNFCSANQAVVQEAASTTVLARAAQELPAPMRVELLTHLHNYINLLITDEWPLMAQGQGQASPQAMAEFNELWHVCQNKLTQVPGCSTIQANLGQLSIRRALRLLSGRDYLPDIFWVVLLLGTLIVIFTNLFLFTDEIGLGKQLFLQALKISSIALLLWLIISINNPYAGDPHITTDAFQYPLSVIKSLSP